MTDTDKPATWRKVEAEAMAALQAAAVVPPGCIEVAVGLDAKGGAIRVLYLCDVTPGFLLAAKGLLG